MIDRLGYEDEGNYECRASNTVAGRILETRSKLVKVCCTHRRKIRADFFQKGLVPPPWQILGNPPPSQRFGGPGGQGPPDISEVAPLELLD